jgi:hypothetical protein
MGGIDAQQWILEPELTVQAQISAAVLIEHIEHPFK